MHAHIHRYVLYHATKIEWRCWLFGAAPIDQVLNRSSFLLVPLPSKERCFHMPSRLGPSRVHEKWWIMSAKDDRIVALKPFSGLLCHAGLCHHRQSLGRMIRKSPASANLCLQVTRGLLSSKTMQLRISHVPQGQFVQTQQQLIRTLEWRGAVNDSITGPRLWRALGGGMALRTVILCAQNDCHPLPRSRRTQWWCCQRWPRCMVPWRPKARGTAKT